MKKSPSMIESIMEEESQNVEANENDTYKVLISKK
jgi:hypothetical protein